MTSPGIHAEGLRKSYGEVHALAGIDLDVPEGSVLGLLGPNGAGKTTAVRILTTLLAPDGGRASVAGFDVVRQARELRGAIGLAGQFAAVDANLTGRENLELVGRLYHLSRADARRRAGELLEQFDLVEAADRLAKTYSGGMKRRLDLAGSLVSQPPVLFLDEPTTGLDPRSRLGLWEVIGGLVRDGTTILLTTQYLEEADRLADRIAVIDLGRVIAEGTADELKASLGGEVLEFTLAPDADLSRAAEVIAPLGSAAPVIEQHGHTVHLPVDGGPSVLTEVIRRLDAESFVVTDLSLHRPTLDDVFLRLTGHHAEDPDADAAPAAAGRGRPGRGAAA